MTSTAFKVDNLIFADEQAVLAHLRGLSGELTEGGVSAFYSNQPYTDVFYKESQGEAFEGQWYAHPVGTIDQSDVGIFLDKIKSQNKLSPEFSRLLAREASRLYAENARGDVVAFVFESTNRPLFTEQLNPDSERELRARGFTDEQIEYEGKRDLVVRGLNAEQLSDPTWRDDARDALAKWHPYHSIWFDVELPTLLANENIRTINGISRQVLADYWEKNNYSTQSLLRVSKDVSDGAFKNFNLSETPHGSGPKRGSPEGSDDPDSGVVVLSNDGSITFTSSRQTAKSLRVSSEGIEQSRDLFRIHETLPGGVVLSIMPNSA